MIRELNRNTETNWGEKIQLEMTLQDLQVIYDCIGSVPSKYLEEKHKYTTFKPLYGNIINNLYEDLDIILMEHNGITDSNKMVDTNVELEIKNNE